MQFNTDFHSVLKSAKLWRPDRVQNFIDLQTDSWFNINENYTDSDKHFELDGNPDNIINVIRSRKILLYPTNTQRKKLLSWMESYRLVYNKTIDYAQENKVKSWKMARNAIKKIIPNSWKTNDIPIHTLDNAIHDVYKALKTLITQKKFSWQNYKKFPLRYKKIGNPRKIVKLEAQSFSKKTRNTIGNGIGKIKCSEDFIKIKKDSIIQYNCHTKEFYLFMPFVRQTQGCTGHATCSLDPGLRTFLTGYVTGRNNHIVNICENPMKKVEKKIELLDKLKENKVWRKYHKTQKKLNNIIDDMHWKACNYLCSNYKTIVIGMMSTKSIVRGNKLTPNQKKLAYILSHYTFRMRLKSKCEEFGVRFIETEESYTSKTCSECGNKKEDLGSNKIYNCVECNNIFDRDVNGARNILIKVM